MTPSPTLRAIVVRTPVFAVLWWVLAEGRNDSWGIGAVAVVIAVVASMKLLAPTSGLSLAGLPGFLGFFVYQSVKGGIQVTRMALRPRMDLRPRLMEIPLRLPEGQSQILLAGTMNLLPGTVSAGLAHNCLRLHVLDERLPIEHEVRTAERQLARLLRVDLK